MALIVWWLDLYLCYHSVFITMFEANVVLKVGGEDYQLMKQCLVIGSPVSLQQYSRCLFTINCLVPKIHFVFARSEIKNNSHLPCLLLIGKNRISRKNHRPDFSDWQNLSLVSGTLLGEVIGIVSNVKYFTSYQGIIVKQTGTWLCCRHLQRCQ